MVLREQRASEGKRKRQGERHTHARRTRELTHTTPSCGGGSHETVEGTRYLARHTNKQARRETTEGEERSRETKGRRRSTEAQEEERRLRRARSPPSRYLRSFLRRTSGQTRARAGDWSRLVVRCVNPTAIAPKQREIPSFSLKALLLSILVQELSAHELPSNYGVAPTLSNLIG